MLPLAITPATHDIVCMTTRHGVWKISRTSPSQLWRAIDPDGPEFAHWATFSAPLSALLAISVFEENPSWAEVADRWPHVPTFLRSWTVPEDPRFVLHADRLVYEGTLVAHCEDGPLPAICAMLLNLLDIHLKRPFSERNKRISLPEFTAWRTRGTTGAAADA